MCFRPRAESRGGTSMKKSWHRERCRRSKSVRIGFSNLMKIRLLLPFSRPLLLSGLPIRRPVSIRRP